MAVESYCDQLAGASELLRSQVAAGQNSDDVLESMYRSWQQRLSGMAHCGSPKQKSALTEAITAGPWTSEQRKELANAVLNNGGGSAMPRNQLAVRTNAPTSLKTWYRHP